MSVISFPALRAVQNGHVMFLVSIPAAKLKLLNLKVERFDSTQVERLQGATSRTKNTLSSKATRGPWTKTGQTSSLLT